MRLPHPGEKEVPPDESLSPEEQLDRIFPNLQNELAEDLILRMQQISPAASESLVLKLLNAIGYGGAVANATLVTGKPGDGGIDGIIKQDRLGLEVVYVQAKRWHGSIGSPAVMQFCGGLTARITRPKV